MLYVVFGMVMALGIVSLAAVIVGMCSYNDPYAPESIGTLAAGVAGTAFGSAIILSAVYTKLPFTAEGYAAPIGFVLLGLPFLLVGIRQRFVENSAPSVVS